MGYELLHSNNAEKELGFLVGYHILDILINNILLWQKINVTCGCMNRSVLIKHTDKLFPYLCTAHSSAYELCPPLGIIF